MQRSVNKIGATPQRSYPGLISLFLLLMIAEGISQAHSSHASGELLSLAQPDLWRYRWGLKQPPQADDGHWQPIDFPSNPPGRDGQTMAWYRLTLPQGSWRDPALFITSIDLNARFYLNGREIYTWGPMDATGQGRFVGWPWHLIPLPLDAGGQTLDVQVFSDYADIGLWGKLELGEHALLLNQLIEGSFSSLVMTVLNFLVALFALLLFVSQRQFKGYLPLALLGICHGIMVWRQVDLRQLVYFAPLIDEYLSAFAYFIAPLAVAGFMETTMGPGPMQLTRRIWQLHLIYPLGAAAALMLGITDLATTYPPFDLLNAITFPSLVAIAFYHAYCQGDLNAKLLAGGFAIMAGVTLYDAATANGLLPYAPQRIEWAALAFQLVLGSILIHRYRETQRQLQELTLSLETRVKKRTQALAKANEQLINLARIDSLTGLLNRRAFLEQLEQEAVRTQRTDTPLGLLMLDVDHFKSINDTYGHAIGDQVLKGLSHKLSQEIRTIDTAGRIGGEEFALILVNSSLQEATETAERIRLAVAGMKIQAEGLDLFISVSIGATTLGDQEKITALLHRADQAMYQGKHRGRNRVVAIAFEPETEK
jgi:diguanylate cyclase (GGDEF)-like protein